ncbi:MAG: asparagine synthase (glutamine-hydrolyzing) [Nitrospirota bacterium]
MCGIAGIVTYSRSHEGGAMVKGMLSKMPYRGPDQSGVETRDNVTLGMARLSIIDREHHKIPYADAFGKYMIVYNGEIYNHDTLKHSLRSRCHFQTASDAETVLYNFMEKGIDSLHDYNGMYAFALYDSVNKELYIARDKTGEKPLYYAYTKDYFVFASEMKCLLQVVPAELNNDAVSYRAYEFTVGAETLFKNIYSLGPGEYIRVKDGRVSVQSYWKVWDKLVDVKTDEKGILDDLAELLEDAILLRTKNCAHKYCAFISGGVDSSLVASIAKPDYIFTAHYDYDDFDELDYAKLLARHIQRDLVVITPTKEDFMRTRNDIIYHLDTPCTWTSFTLWMLFSRTKEEGLKVVMTGDGADEIFGGYHRYHLLHHDEQIHKLEAMQQYSYLINRYYGSPVDRYLRLVNRHENQYDERINGYLRESLKFYYEKAKGDVIHFMGLNDFYSTMQVLLQMADRLSMAFSIENRSPFLDYRLVQYAFSMPSKYKIRNGITKWALKEVSKKFIPKEIASRIDKRGFSAPVNKWFGWDKNGKYDRRGYKDIVFDDWIKRFGVSKNEMSIM